MYLDPLFVIDVSKYVNSQYVRLLDDMMRTIVIQLGISVLLFLSSGSGSPPPHVVFQMIMYALVGTCLYYLVFQKLVVFK